MVSSIDYSKIADIYDSYVTADFDIPFWIREATRVRGSVLELTCGTGRISVPLLRAGVGLTCVDSCQEMLAVLKEKIRRLKLDCTIVRMDIARLSLPIRYDFIFIPFNTFSEIMDCRAQAGVLARIRRHLTEEGEFICTLHNPDIRRADLDGSDGVIGVFPIASGGTLVVRRCMNFERSSGIAHGVQSYEFRDSDDKTIGNRSVEVSFRLPEREEFEELAARSGFVIMAVYGNYDYSKFEKMKSPFMIWRLKPLQA